MLELDLSDDQSFKEMWDRVMGKPPGSRVLIIEIREASLVSLILGDEHGDHHLTGTLSRSRSNYLKEKTLTMIWKHQQARKPSQQSVRLW
jgi:hypothetical protein